MILRHPYRPHAAARPGLSLLEVIVALAIFLFSLIIIGQLITLSGDLALDVQHRNQAAQLCQAKLAEIVAGAVPLSGQGETPFDEDPNWLWSMTADQGNVTGLWNVTVSVSRKQGGNSMVETSVSQMVLDPSLKGSATDAALTASATTSTTDTTTSGTTSGPTTSPPTTQGGQTTAGASSSKTTPSSGAAAAGSSAGKTTTPTAPTTNTGKTTTPTAPTTNTGKTTTSKGSSK